MNCLHLQFGNFCYELLKFVDHFIFEMSLLAKHHPVLANTLLFLFAVLAFGVTFLFFDFIEERYVPKVKAFSKESADSLKAIFRKIGKAMSRFARRLVQKSVYLAIFAIPIFLLSILLKGGR